MTKFISLEENKEKQETVFTHYFQNNKGWVETSENPLKLDKVLYLGTCDVDGDMFAAYTEITISIYKGIKGNEFD